MTSFITVNKNWKIFFHSILIIQEWSTFRWFCHSNQQIILCLSVLYFESTSESALKIYYFSVFAARVKPTCGCWGVDIRCATHCSPHNPLSLIHSFDLDQKNIWKVDLPKKQNQFISYFEGMLDTRPGKAPFACKGKLALLCQKLRWMQSRRKQRLKHDSLSQCIFNFVK